MCTAPFVLMFREDAERQRHRRVCKKLTRHWIVFFVLTCLRTLHSLNQQLWSVDIAYTILVLSCTDGINSIQRRLIQVEMIIRLLKIPSQPDSNPQNPFERVKRCRERKKASATVSMGVNDGDGTFVAAAAIQVRQRHNVCSSILWDHRWNKLFVYFLPKTNDALLANVVHVPATQAHSFCTWPVSDVMGLYYETFWPVHRRVS